MEHPSDSYIRTRVAILAARLIEQQSWPGIIESDLEALQQQFHTVIDSSAHESVEKQLIDQALTDFQLLFRPFSGSSREMLNHAAHWYELTNLKTLIRGKFSGMSQSEIRHQLIDLKQFAVLPLNTLLEADDPYEMLRLLESTPYSNIVRQARTVFEDEQNLFALDSAIDRHFFRGLRHRIRFLPVADQRPFSTLYGTVMDRLNLLWLVRYRFSYHLSPAKSYYHLATEGNKLHSTTLMKLAQLETLQELIDQLPSPLNHLLRQVKNLSDIEILMEHYTLSAARKALKQSTSVLTRVYCYVVLRESEIRSLQAVFKGKALKLNQKLIYKAVEGTY
ncbi:MAG: V-type ATPase subunit [Gammaproteobacteria bacterium]|jgi:V/A-type H+-transporting ATPase subunit C|nr:V-type ATPase subunit [Gammaproteobacteria bacterium]MBT3488334.1 V-type ATPase subunit [Gammaproteobacteria bacterium]MBT3717379.1 V-type ATPase subunit [Gammaproteobacteria bacterium]MBT3845632.1 V-type ATPase subunit [Gammaproteobacteria bacterium]MBT3892312.1 V-type ATPase subunit [Gammaproteobacteria bacterium]